MKPLPSQKALASLTISLSMFALACDDASDTRDGGSLPEDSGSPVDAGAMDSGTSSDAGAGDAATDGGAFGPKQALLDTGPIEGISAAASTVAFLGVPFAAPPVGDLRFKAPAPVTPWRAPLRADTFPPKCIQKMPGDPVEGEEDCLYLNLWRPEAPIQSGSPRPILVFIHGGGNVTGSTTEKRDGVLLYDGARLAGRADVVVITLQYRLNIIGYMADPSLDGAEPSGNYGPRDQVAALEWIQRNAAAFGGDPDRVMLFGESGGGTDVCALLATPSAAGLFDSAVVMSGGCGGKQRGTILDWSNRIVETVGCDTSPDVAACLRAQDAASLVTAAAQPSVQSGITVSPAAPTIDGAFLPESPLAAFEAGRHNKMPIIIGYTANETASQTFGISPTIDYEATVRSRFSRISTLVLNEYPLSDYPSDREAWIALTTDTQFVCPGQRAAAALAANQSDSVREYVYTHVFQGLNGAGVPILAQFGAAHGFELLPLFQNIDRFPSYTATNDDLEVQKSLRHLWVSFARDGMPSAAGAPSWPVVTTSGNAYYDIREPPATGQDFRKDKCDFWARLSP